LGGAAWITGWVELAVPAGVLLGALATAALMAVGRSAFRTELVVADRRVEVGERAMGELTVANPTRRRLLPARMIVPVGAGRLEFDVGSLAPGARFHDVFAIPTDRRAVVQVGPMRSSRGDPLGLVDRSVHWSQSAALHVHPRVIPLTGSAAGVLRDIEGQATRQLSDSDISFHALREYVPGDDRRNIHWKSSAKLGNLMVRQFEDTRRVHLALALAVAGAEYADDADFELAVAVLASLGVQWLRDKREVTALAGAATLGSAHHRDLLDSVCAIQSGPAAAGSADMARRVAREVPTATLTVLVTGDAASREQLRAAARHLPVGSRVLALRCRVGLAPQIRVSAGITQAQVGVLEDLPGILRRAVPR
jgi:uncharacterized protein (DUF58 family)